MPARNAYPSANPETNMAAIAASVAGSITYHLCELVGLPEIWRFTGGPCRTPGHIGLLWACERGSTRARLAESRSGPRPNEFNNWTTWG